MKYITWLYPALLMLLLRSGLGDGGAAVGPGR